MKMFLQVCLLMEHAMLYFKSDNGILCESTYGGLFMKGNGSLDY